MLAARTPDLDEARNLADVAVGDEVIGDAGDARHRHDQRDVDAGRSRMENVPRDSDAQARSSRPVCGGDASV